MVENNKNNEDEDDEFEKLTPTSPRNKASTAKFKQADFQFSGGRPLSP